MCKIALWATVYHIYNIYNPSIQKESPSIQKKNDNIYNPSRVLVINRISKLDPSINVEKIKKNLRREKNESKTEHVSIDLDRPIAFSFQFGEKQRQL